MITRTHNHHGHHGSSRSGGATRQLFGIASLLNTIAQMGVRYLGEQERSRMETLRAENLQLKNQIADTQKGVISNRVVEGDLKIELLKLKIEAEKRKLGITDAPFVASDYTDPGNIREEERGRNA